MRKQKRSGKKTRNIIINIFFILFLACFLISGGYLFVYYYTNHKAQKSFSEIKNTFETDYIDEDGKEIYVEVEQKQVFKKYAPVYEENPDFVGWLSIEGTNIDYPVMYTPEDEEYYLHRDFDGAYSSAGTLFVDKNCSPVGAVSDNVIIYGHNMKAGTMFHDLLQYESEEFYKSHKTIVFDTLDGTGTYTVIAAFRTQAYEDTDTEHYNYYSFNTASSEEEFDAYISQVKSNTPYTIEESASYGDKLITLSTCAYHSDNGRFVVVAKKTDA